MYQKIKVYLHGLLVQLSDFAVHSTDALKEQGIHGTIKRLATVLKMIL